MANKGRQVTLNPEVYEKLVAFRDKVQDGVGFKVSLAQAITRLLTIFEELEKEEKLNEFSDR